MIYESSVRTSQGSHYASATKTKRLMLFRETLAVYWEIHTEYTDTVRISHETHYVSVKEPNRLMLFGKTVSVYCRTIRNTYVNTLHWQKAAFR
jgi:hypothetical protein